MTPLSRPGRPGGEFAGAPGILARENAMRNPQRTASTASALMIGLALVTLVGMLAASIRASFFDAVDKIWVTDYAVTAQNNYSPIPISVEEPLRGAPGTTAVIGVRAGEAEFLNGTHFHHGRGSWRQQGLRAGLGAGLGRDHGLARRGRRVHRRQLRRGSRLQVGSPVECCFRTEARKRSGSRDLRSTPTGGSPFGVITTSSATFDESFQQPRTFVFVTMNGGETPENTAALDAALTGFNAKL